ncbi:MAG TPA: hypothetical protein DEQ09_04055 [Bacteroidales bacterium]|nr:hypothetical protein [Bacteroidales bacterium]
MKGKQGIIVILIIHFLLGGCAAIAEKMDERREKREKEIEEGYEAVKKMVFSGLYTFTSNSNYLSVNYYDVEVFFPHFGAGDIKNLPGRSHLRINSKLENLMIEESDIRHRVLVRFTVDTKTDKYMINIDIAPNFDANLNISSSKISTITYMGKIRPIENEKEEAEK